MATTLAQKLALATDVTFQGQVKMQIVIEAVSVLTGVKPGGADTNYKKRLQLAQSIINNADSYVIPFANGIASNSALTSPVSDANVATWVTTSFPFIAGITPGEQ